MAKCSSVKCNEIVKRGDEIKVTCSGCIKVFHGGCVNLQNVDIDYMKCHKINWLCQDCKIAKKLTIKSTVNRQNSTTDSPTNVAVLQDDQLKLLEDTISIILERYIVTVDKRLDSIETCLNKLESLCRENINMKRKINDLESRLDKFEQKTRENFIHIQGIQYDEKLNVKDTVMKVVNIGLNAEIRSEDIQSCYFIKKKVNGKDTSNSIMVEFVKRSVKNNIMNLKYKKKPKITGESIGLTNKNNIFINESLTDYKRKLWIQCKDIKNNKHYKYLWMRNSNIMMRQGDGTKIILINSFLDLEKL